MDIACSKDNSIEKYEIKQQLKLSLACMQHIQKNNMQFCVIIIIPSSYRLFYCCKYTHTHTSSADTHSSTSSLLRNLMSDHTHSTAGDVSTYINSGINSPYIFIIGDTESRVLFRHKWILIIKCV